VIGQFKPNGIPILSREDLEEIADAQINAFVRHCGEESFGFSVWCFAAHFLKRTVRFEWLTNNRSILGISVFLNGTRLPLYLPDRDEYDWHIVDGNTILLDKSLQENLDYSIAPARFTLMHECAHQLLHGKYFHFLAKRGDARTAAYSIQRQSEPQDGPIKNAEWTDEDWIEWQANYLAGALLLPKTRVSRALADGDAVDVYWQRVKAKEKESHAYAGLINYVAQYFRVSPRMADIRLQQTGFVRGEDQYKYKPPFPLSYSPGYEPITDGERDWANEEVMNRMERRYLDPDSDWA
jgi:Zn-dependent peptidase ImmA (M78 family)